MENVNAMMDSVVMIVVKMLIVLMIVQMKELVFNIFQHLNVDVNRKIKEEEKIVQLSFVWMIVPIMVFVIMEYVNVLME